jgi:hypothetical protein
MGCFNSGLEWYKDMFREHMRGLDGLGNRTPSYPGRSGCGPC